MFRPLLDRFLEVATGDPERVCLIEGHRRSTYGDVATHVRGAAERLRGKILPGDRVALFVDNSLEFVAACYGTWWAEGVVVALNAALKADDLARLVRHSGATVLVADAAQRELGPLREQIGAEVEVVEVQVGEGFPTPSTASAPPPSVAPETLAGLIYTSGTTGHPKGVMLSHGNLAANVDSICEYLAIGRDEKALCVLPFYYSYGASVLHTHLTRGAAIVIENSFMYPHVVMDRIRAEGVTSFAGVPSTYYLLLRRTDLASFDLSSLRYVTQAGGRMDDKKVQAFREKVPGARFVVMYGQTEATARLSWVPPEDLPTRTGSAGRAIPGVELCVRDEEGRDLPRGETGEVCARGGNVMLGYWSDPEETAKVLRDGWLHTGDLGWIDEDGFLYLIGRSREMIKSGAHRISPAEIEEVILTVPGVEEVAVAGTPDEVLGQGIKAYVISRRSGDALRQEILRTCRARLALFKIPKEVEFRTAFPRTVSGKVQKHLLHIPQSTESEAYVAKADDQLLDRIFSFDMDREVNKISARLRDLLRSRLRRRGLVVAVSGGIDSSVCAALAVRAVGADKVFALLMPERDSSSASSQRGRALAEHLGVEYELQDIAPTLEAIGCYRWRDEAIRRVFPGYGEGWKNKIAIAGGESGRFNHFKLIVQDPSGAIHEDRLGVREYLQIVAATNFKQRVRKTLEFFHADRLNYAVVGTPNRVEYDQGFFVKNGDGSADVKPIAHLYKVQVYMLARHLGLPPEICNATPTTDTYSLPQGQDEFYYALPYREMDVALWHHNQGKSPAELGQALGIGEEQARIIYADIDNKRRTTAPLHWPALLVEPVKGPESKPE